MPVITEFVTMDTITCCNCCICFAMPRQMLERLRERGGNFYCPNGHGQSFTQTEVMRLRAEIEGKTKTLTNLMTMHAQEKKLREAAERKVERASKGVCTCCKRSFTNLRRHMETKHPDVLKTKNAAK